MPGASETLQEKGEKADITRFVEQMTNLNLYNSVFVDCTSSETVAGLYHRILRWEHPHRGGQ